MADSCIKCKKEIRKRQEAILCDKCEKWCDRTCGTGIDRSVYRRMVKGEVTVDWQCADCINAQQLIELQPEDPQPEQHQREPPKDTSVPPFEITEPDEDTHLAPFESTRISLGIHDTSRQMLPDVSNISEASTGLRRNATFTVVRGDGAELNNWSDRFQHQ